MCAGLIAFDDGRWLSEKSALGLWNNSQHHDLKALSLIVVAFVSDLTTGGSLRYDCYFSAISGEWAPVA